MTRFENRTVDAHEGGIRVRQGEDEEVVGCAGRELRENRCNALRLTHCDLYPLRRVSHKPRHPESFHLR